MFNSFIVSQPVFKKILLNGLVVLVRPVHDVPKVHAQISYHVGAKHESTGQRGLAHLIEHMIFKGTKNLLSEKDWAAVAQKLSVYTNAFTGYDSTTYIFDGPSHSWKEAFVLYADTMRNCRFDEQMLNSELEVVVQELKGRRDDYYLTLVLEMCGRMFPHHPYHYPVLGFKKDLWSLQRDILFAFYQKHYVPNNAVLTVVGDVEPDEVFAYAEKMFGGIAKDSSYKRKEFHVDTKVPAQSVVMYQDITQPYGLFAFILPGIKEKQVVEIELLARLLGKGKNSRLAKKVVDELGLVTCVSTFTWPLEDATLFAIYYNPKNAQKSGEIKAAILQELQIIAQHGIPQKELSQHLKRLKVSLLSSFESNQTQATFITESFLFAEDENWRFKVMEYSIEGMSEKIQHLAQTYFSPASMHWGQVFPLPEKEKKYARKVQELSDKEDAQILKQRPRTLPLEEPRYAHSVEIQESKPFHFHRPEKCILSNGIRVFSHNSKKLPKIELIFSFYADNSFDSTGKPGLYWFMTEMLAEGTVNYPGLAFRKELEDHAMTLSVTDESICLSMLKEDLPKGLELVRELLTHATFEEKAIEKVRVDLIARLKRAWDDPSWYAQHLVREHLYKGHPFGKTTYGTVESLKSITKQDLEGFYKTYISPYKARIALVGDLEGYSIRPLLEKELGGIGTKEIPELLFPSLAPVQKEVIIHHAERDQVVLMLAGLSVPQTHPDYDKLLLFDELLSGYGASNSYLFQLRDKTGFFYTLFGSVTGGATEQPGMVSIFSLVSLDRLEEAKKALYGLLDTVADRITPQELEVAKRSILSNDVNRFSFNSSMAHAFLFFDRYKKPDNYCDTRSQVINAITVEEVKEAVKKVLVPEKMITLQIGRFN